jgi:mono/diheme cytochrome c family protein
MALSRSTRTAFLLRMATAFFVGTLAVQWCATAQAANRVDFDRAIRPIFAENCYACHGPDGNSRKAELRLDRKDDAFRERPEGAVIVRGDVDESMLTQRIASDDPEEVMPPPKTGKRLTQAQIDLVKLWVKQGAEWPGHWAYQTPVRPDPPEVRGKKWARNPIDIFVLDALEQRGLRPSPEAGRETLIRRVSFDLTGLPPTLAEIDAFLADSSPNAYEKVVDRLLASPQYGERMAQHWLDLARYADTNGYHIDNHRDIWKYREWVINAFNQNMPFDEFTIEQLAGDLLQNATIEQKIASGFHRNVMVNFEGGADPDEYLTKYVGDRVNTTATVFLGATMACAECHDHKYDPFTQKDFYRFYAFFNTVAEKGLDGNKESPAPRLQVPTPEQARKLEELHGQITRLEDTLKGPLPVVDAAQVVWEQEQAEVARNPLLGWKPIELAEFASQKGATLLRLDDQSVLASGTNPDQDVYEVAARTKVTGIRAVRLEALTHDSLPHKGAARSDGGNFVLTGFEVETAPEGSPGEASPVAFSRAEADYVQLEGGDFSAGKAIDGDPKSGWAVGGDKLRVNRQAIFVAKTPFGFEGGTKLKVRLRFESSLPKHAIGRFRLSFTITDQPKIETEMPKAITQSLAVAEESRTEAQRSELSTFYRTKISPEGQALSHEIAGLRAAESALNRMVPVTMVMQEMAQPRKTFVLVRGDFRSKGEEVTPGVPEVLPPLPQGLPANRLSLAKWLVDPGHPLVARVTVNRYWQHYFGTGIVKTANDFGTQGDWPSHPELLDWLATEFIADKWDIKAMQKLIVMSATYRQSSKVDHHSLELDPENRLLARGPRYRLDAEEIRDNALALSGLLNPQLGGPSVYPYQPPGLWEEIAFGNEFSSQSYTPSKGADLYRRGIYTYWKRSVPYPSLTAFDAPNRELCTVQRPRTNTPLQALTLLNDPVFVEAARGLAQRTLIEGGTDTTSRLRFAFRVCTARWPQPKELEVLTNMYNQQLDHYRGDSKAAQALLRVGESPCPADMNPAELAAWTAIGNVLLNLDETISKG